MKFASPKRTSYCLGLHHRSPSSQVPPPVFYRVLSLLDNLALQCLCPQHPIHDPHKQLQLRDLEEQVVADSEEMRLQILHLNSEYALPRPSLSEIGKG